MAELVHRQLALTKHAVLSLEGGDDEGEWLKFSVSENNFRTSGADVAPARDRVREAERGYKKFYRRSVREQVHDWPRQLRSERRSRRPTKLVRHYVHVLKKRQKAKTKLQTVKVRGKVRNAGIQTLQLNKRKESERVVEHDMLRHYFYSWVTTVRFRGERKECKVVQHKSVGTLTDVRSNQSEGRRRRMPAVYKYREEFHLKHKIFQAWRINATNGKILRERRISLAVFAEMSHKIRMMRSYFDMWVSRYTFYMRLKSVMERSLYLLMYRCFASWSSFLCSPPVTPNRIYISTLAV